MNPTWEHVEHVSKKAESWKHRFENFKKKIKAKETTQKVVRTLEIGTAAAVGGVIQGKAGPAGAHLFHVPVVLGAGLLLNLAGYFGLADDYSDHLNNFGDGMIAAYTNELGFHMGQTWASTGKLFGSKAAPSLPAPAKVVGEISPEQMAQILHNVAQAQAAR